MLEQHPSYNPPPQGPMMPPPPPPNRPRGWRERWMQRFGMEVAVPMQKGERTIPNWLIGVGGERNMLV